MSTNSETPRHEIEDDDDSIISSHSEMYKNLDVGAPLSANVSADALNARKRGLEDHEDDRPQAKMAKIDREQLAGGDRSSPAGHPVDGPTVQGGEQKPAAQSQPVNDIGDRIAQLKHKLEELEQGVERPAKRIAVDRINTIEDHAINDHVMNDHVMTDAYPISPPASDRAASPVSPKHALDATEEAGRPAKRLRTVVR